VCIYQFCHALIFIFTTDFQGSFHLQGGHGRSGAQLASIHEICAHMHVCVYWY
jgi:hypothetical protein